MSLKLLCTYHIKQRTTFYINRRTGSCNCLILSPQCHSSRIAISISHCLYTVYMLLVLFIMSVNISIMCLHPVVDRNLATTLDKYETVGLEEYDNCDYVYSLNDVCKDDLVVIQLNIQGISSKRSHLKST